ncbi:DUF484 family protein [Wenxinia saemankumensis]|uniref:DUF484 domain-containing protein n=1 Tax=Wenxinia saemankumensis TaxID=1447782 RepID=A0A1M6CE61_9RHOB|nr:DUF484 family protein [Wenxinia saemankumensis]SHI58988.1 hypothetical protein SAMN05444417_1135 [Wenxinia saemankumensis]
MDQNLAALDATLRDRIISDPDALLDDAEVMAALVAANERAMGTNIVDLRGIAMERLEARLDRLEDTHRSVIAAAYENLAGTNQIHRAILKLLEPAQFEVFLRDLGTEVAQILRVDELRLVLEAEEGDGTAALARLGDVLSLQPAGFIADYVNHGRAIPLRQVTLRQIGPDAVAQSPLWSGRTAIRSEVCLLLDFGPDTAAGLLVMGSEDPHLFSPQQGTDLLGFFAGVFERAMRRWLA